MPRSLQQERQAIDAERDKAIRALDRSVVVKLPIDRLSSLFDRVGKLRIDEAERKLASGWAAPRTDASHGRRALNASDDRLPDSK